jgi:hypothetical protein
MVCKECVPRHLVYLLYFFLLLQVVFVRRLELEKAELQVPWNELYIRNVVLEARIGVGPPLDVLGYFENIKFCHERQRFFWLKH